MPSQLVPLLRNIQTDNVQAVDLVEGYRHPLLLLLKAALGDQQTALRSFIDELEGRSRPPVRAFKTACTRVYHANEVSMPFYESWKRAVGWMPDPSGDIGAELGTLMERMHANLEEAAQLLEAEYGHMAVKYVIPSFYLPATT